MSATIFYRDGRKEVVTGMMGDIFDQATQRGAYRIQTETGSVARMLFGEWTWFK